MLTGASRGGWKARRWMAACLKRCRPWNGAPRAERLLLSAYRRQARESRTLHLNAMRDVVRRLLRCRESRAELSNTMRILLARHGETPWNAEGRYQGQEDIALSPVGESQARALGERLREVRIDRAVASPLSRARRTAELALGESRTGMLTLDPGLLEIAHGTWEGLLAAEIRERDPERLAA